MVSHGEQSNSDAAATVEPYVLVEGIYRSSRPVVHRDEEYNERGFETLARMQERHFWYVGRHRFLLRAVRRQLAARGGLKSPPRVIDLGGGCGGWVSYLAKGKRIETSELALADSSLAALHHAADFLPAGVDRYQVDLLDLRWRERWDVAFMLDVLEHIPEQDVALRQVHDALAPGGLLFITVPALRAFWSWNDVVAGHQRRYHRADFRRLAGDSGFRLVDARYFMFVLSPLLLLSRLATRPNLATMSEDEVWSLTEKMHRVPARPINAVLATAFRAETPLGHHVRFPWGSSLLAILQKPGAPGNAPDVHAMR